MADPVPVANPGFEEDADADGMPDGWRDFIHGEGFQLTLSDEVRHSGERSMRITGLPEHGSRACVLQVTQPVPVAPAYQLSLFIRGEGQATGILRFRYQNAQGEDADFTHDFNIEEVSVDEWREKSFEFPISKDLAQLLETRIEIILYQRGTGDIYYDDVSLEALREWTPRMDAAPQPLQTPRRPEDGRSVLQNPPDFTWNPAATAETYELQLCPDEAFGEGTITVDDLPYNCYSHSRVLQRVTWHWRYRFVDMSGAASEWSPAWRFEVDPDAFEFPVPSPEDLLDRIPLDHPRVYATAASLDEFRAPLAAERTEWWETFSQRLENYLTQELPQEPGPEYDFSKREGRLTAADKKKMDELRGLGSRATAPMWRLAFGYLVSGQERYAAGAAERLMAMADWDPEGTTGYRNHDQVFRDIAWKTACAYDWIWDVLTPDQRVKGLNAVVARGRILYRDFREDSRPIYEWPYDSHGWTSMGLLGIITIALAHDFPEADEWLKFVAATYTPLYPPWGGEEGGWCQGVSYWKYSCHYAGLYFDALKSATGVDMYDKAFCRNNGWYKLYMHPPWCTRAHFGDQNLGAPSGSDRSNLLLYATRYNDPYFAWYADQIPGARDTDVYGYWWYDYELPRRPPADLVQSRYQADIGWVAMHSDLSDPDDIMLMFKSSPMGSYNHSHADQNHFVIYGFGEPLLIDSGYYDWYMSPHDERWTNQTRAHNSVLVNGEGQPIKDITAKGRIADYFASPGGVYTVGDATAAYKGKLSRFLRHIIYVRPNAFLIYDDLEAPEPSTFTWCCHALEEMQLDEGSRRITVTRGDATLEIFFAMPETVTMRQDNDFGTDPQGRYADQPKQWHCYVKSTEKATTQQFVALIRVHRYGPDVEFRVSQPAQGEGIFANLIPCLVAAVPTGDSEALAVRGLKFDGHLLAMGGDEGPEILAVDATYLGEPGEARVGFRATRPLTLWGRFSPAMTLRQAQVRVSEPTQVTFPLGGDTDIVRLDARELREGEYSYDAPKSLLTVNLSTGEHVLQATEEAARGFGTVNITVGGQPADLALETLHGYAGGQLLHGTLPAKPGPYSLTATLGEGQRATMNREAVSGDQPLVWLSETNSLEIRFEQPGDIGLALNPLDYDPQPRVARTIEGLPDHEAITFEAETFTAHGGGNPSRYSHRTFLSGGVGVGEWIVPGMWLEWQLQVPQAGDYHFIIKGATHEPHADRLILLDGKPLGDEFLTYRFKYTGGFGATPEEWRHFLVIEDGGQPQVLTLNVGEHALRMICLTNRLNLDYLALVPAD